MHGSRGEECSSCMLPREVVKPWSTLDRPPHPATLNPVPKVLEPRTARPNPIPSGRSNRTSHSHAPHFQKPSTSTPAESISSK
eukprot:142208-Chlamydomonas_euryale.AAC.1